MYLYAHPGCLQKRRMVVLLLYRVRGRVSRPEDLFDMIYFLLILSVLFSSGKSLLSKALGLSMGSARSFFLMNTLISAAALAVLTGTVLAGNMLGGSGTLSLSLFTVLTAVGFAAATVGAQYFYMRALAAGPMAFGALVYSCGFIIPTVLGTIIWHESVSAFQLVGMLLLPAAFALYGSKGDGFRLNQTCVVCAVTASALSGVIGLAQKVHQTSTHRGELDGFLLLAFAMIAASSLILFFLTGGRLRCGGTRDAAPSPYTLPLTLLTGVCVGGANRINLYLSGALPSMIFFPVVNGGVVVASGVLAHLCFKEKLSRREIAGLALGVVAIALAGIK